MTQNSASLTRRDLLKAAGAAAVASGLSPSAAAQPPANVVGIQVGAVSFVDEGVEPLFDVVQKRANVNTIFLATFTYGRGIAGRQIPGQPLPDHGKQEYDTNFHGGNYATPHPEFYAKTVLKNVRAPDHGDLDILATVLPKAKARGLRVYAWAEDVWRSDVPNIQQVQETDFHGRRRTTTCYRNPDYRGFLEGLVQDYAKSYPIDGLMWGSERQGPLNYALGAVHAGGVNAGQVGCFCQFCRAEAKHRGIDDKRAVEGYTALEKYIQAVRGNQKPRDGAFVAFWRLLTDYPEIIAWEKLWNDGQFDSYQYIRAAAKSVRNLPVGFHIWHLVSFSPLYRAVQDYAKLAATADFLKPVLYNNCAGPRLVAYIRNVQRTLFNDLTPDEVLRLHYRWLNYEEKSLAELALSGLSPDYVYRETKRAKDDVAGKVPIYPGIDVDLPTGANQKKTTPADASASVQAALRGGADGVILSRKYSEMKLANLSGAGDGLRAAGVVK